MKSLWFIISNSLDLLAYFSVSESVNILSSAVSYFNYLFLQNEQLRQDVIDYQRQLETQKETLLSRRGEDSDYRSQLSKKNFELVQYLDEIQVNFKELLSRTKWSDLTLI